MEKRFIGINLIADQSAYTWGLIHQGQMLITFINIDRGYRMHQQNIYTTEIHKWVDGLFYGWFLLIYYYIDKS